MRVLVTGGSGFLGQATVPLLVDGEHDVVALARGDASAATVSSLGASVVRGDLDDAASIDDAFTAVGADALVNLASLGFGHAEVIVAAAEASGIRRAVFISTTAIFTALSAASRAVRIAAEDTVRASALDWTILRPTMIYGGPGDRNLSRLLALLRRAPVLPVPGGGRRLQQPVHVDDIAAAVVAAVERPAAIGRAYDIAGPEPLAFRDLLVETGEAAGRTPVLVPVPAGPVIVAARVYERVARRPRITAEQIERLAEDKAFAIDDARRDLDFSPRPFSVGIRQEAALLR